MAIAIDNVIIKLTILRHFKMGPELVTNGDSVQTAAFITSRQCVEAAGTGLGPSDNVKRMIAGGIGCSVRLWSLLVSCWPAF